MASHDRAEPITTVTTDASGRAALVMPMPDELAESPHLVLDATCPRGVRRLFDVDLELESRERVILTFDRAAALPGGSVLAIGRVLDRATGRGIAGTQVDVHVQQGGPVGAPRRVVTDASGLFVTRITTSLAGTEPTIITAVTVHEGGGSASASRNVGVASSTTRPPLSLRVTTVPAVAAPGALVDVLVEVRSAEGLPVEGALVTGPPIDPLPEGAARPEIRTDARGPRPSPVAAADGPRGRRADRCGHHGERHLDRARKRRAGCLDPCRPTQRVREPRALGWCARAGGTDACLRACRWARWRAARRS